MLIHGMRESPEYATWERMIGRCENPAVESYKYYGARGIRVCPAWRESFVAFFNDMGRRPSTQHSLDRIDPDGNYQPGNCRWATIVEQRRNRRDVKLYDYMGAKRPLIEIAEMVGANFSTVCNQVRRGWSIEKITDKAKAALEGAKP